MTCILQIKNIESREKRMKEMVFTREEKIKMKMRKSIITFALASMLSLCSLPVNGEETTEAQTQKVMTEEEKREEEAKQYLETNGIWTLSENMTMSLTLPDDSWQADEEGNAGYECRFVSGESMIEIQIFSDETAQIDSEDIPKDKEELQSMVEEEIEVIQFETEFLQEQTIIKTILSFPETDQEIYRYAVSVQLYQEDKYLEATAHTDDEQIIYLLMESLSSAELL